MATVTELSFRTPDLFEVVRGSLLLDEGLVVGQDSELDLVFAMADAAFYELEVFVKSEFKFSSGAKTAEMSDPTIRVIANGCMVGSEAPIKNGEQLTSRSGTPNYWYLGKTAARGIDSYWSARGLPSPTFLKEAMNYLLPIVVLGVPCGIKEEQAGGAPSRWLLTSTHATKQWTVPQGVGKVVYGLHRSSRIVFFLVQKHTSDKEALETCGIAMWDLIDTLVAHGVDEASLGDGSDSVALVVDGDELTEMAFSKQVAITYGLQLRLAIPTVTSGSTRITAATDPALQALIGGDLSPGAQAAVAWSSAGLQITITSFGGNLSATQLHIATLPVTLTAVSGVDIAEAMTFRSDDGAIELSCVLEVASGSTTDRGTFTGSFSIVEGDPAARTSVCEGSIAWAST